MRFAFTRNRNNVKQGPLILGHFPGGGSVIHLFYTTTNQLKQAGKQLRSIYQGSRSAYQTFALSG